MRLILQFIASSVLSLFPKHRAFLVKNQYHQCRYKFFRSRMPGLHILFLSSVFTAKWQPGSFMPISSATYFFPSSAILSMPDVF